MYFRDIFCDILRLDQTHSTEHVTCGVSIIVLLCVFWRVALGEVDGCDRILNTFTLALVVFWVNVVGFSEAITTASCQKLFLLREKKNRKLFPL